MITQKFTEMYALLKVDYVNSQNTEQNTGYASTAGYPAGFIVIHPNSLGGALDVDVEQATDTSGTSAKSFNSGASDVTVQQADTAPTVINWEGSQFDADNEFDCINVEVTPGASSTWTVEIWGLAEERPASTTNLDSVDNG